MSAAARWRARAYTVLFLFAVTFVFIAGLTLLHLATRERVAQNEALFLQRAVREAAGLDPLPAAADLQAWFAAAVTETARPPAPPCYRVAGAAAGAPAAWVFLQTGAGLWGPITAAVGLDPGLRRITGVAFVSHTETPGLGARIEEPWFRGQFRGKTGPFALVPEHTRSAAPTAMDAITGATITTRAVRDLLHAVLDEAPARAGAPRGAGGS